MPVEYGSLPVRLAEYPEVSEFFAESILGIMPQSMVQPMSFLSMRFKIGTTRTTHKNNFSFRRETSRRS